MFSWFSDLWKTKPMRLITWHSIHDTNTAFKWLSYCPTLTLLIHMNLPLIYLKFWTIMNNSPRPALLKKMRSSAKCNRARDAGMYSTKAFSSDASSAYVCQETLMSRGAENSLYTAVTQQTAVWWDYVHRGLRRMTRCHTRSAVAFINMTNVFHNFCLVSMHWQCLSGVSTHLWWAADYRRNVVVVVAHICNHSALQLCHI